MIRGSGIDIIEIGRFRRAKKKYGKNFLKKVFTPGEIEYSGKKRFQEQHLAARFAAKEAVLKAFGNKIASISNWQDIEILNDKSGRPFVRFHGSAKKLKVKERISDVIVSMAHSGKHAVASAILIK